MAPVRLSALEPLLWAAGAVVLAVVPFALSTFQVVQITVFLIFCLLAVSLDLSWGLAGLLSFGQAAFFGLGGYAYAILCANDETPGAALAAGAVAGGVAG